MCSNGFILQFGSSHDSCDRYRKQSGVTSGLLVVHSLFDCVLLAACSQHIAFMPDVKKIKKIKDVCSADSLGHSSLFCAARPCYPSLSNQGLKIECNIKIKEHFHTECFILLYLILRFCLLKCMLQ